MVNIIKKTTVLTLPLVIIGMVTYGSLVSAEKLPSGKWLSQIPQIDKIVHFIFYFAIVAALRFSFTAFGRGTVKIKTVIVVSAIIYGGIIEILQGMFFSRSADSMDFLANLAGAVCAGFLLPQRIFNVLGEKRK
ncbi:MAG: VanZ family protein [Rikenellaceae bacterium]|nr:VanZ family protein [Rikenellaceae bacterium]